MSDGTTAEAQASAAGFPPDTKGVTPPSEEAPRGGFLSDVLIEMGFSAENVVEDALGIARQSGRSVEAVLIANGAISEDQLARAVAERHGLDYVDLATFEPDLGAAGLIGRATATRYGAVPIAFAEDDALIVAVHDPVDGLAIDDIAVITKSEVRVAVATRSAIADLVERAVPEDAPQRPHEPEPFPVDGDTDGSEAGVNGTDVGGTPSPEIFAAAPSLEGPDSTAVEAGGLSEELAAAEAARNAAVAERETLVSERDSAVTERDELRAEVERQAAEVERQAAELERLSAEQDSNKSASEEATAAEGKKAKKLKAELETAERERDELRSELERQAAELERLSGEQSERQSELGDVTAKVSALEEERDSVTSQRDELRSELERLSGEQSERKSAGEEEAAAAREEAERLRSDLSGATEKVGALEEERDSAMSERDEVRSELDRQAAELERLSGEQSEKRSAGEEEAAAAREEAERLRSELNGVTSRVGALEEERDSAMSERDELRSEAEKLRGELTDIASRVDADLPAGAPGDLTGQLEAIRVAAERAKETAIRERSDAEKSASALRVSLEQANQRTRDLEERLAELAAAADDARSATEKLASLQERARQDPNV